MKTVFVTGPTACGKTALAVDLAGNFNGEIISADSRQVYRHMDIGTGKDLDLYRNAAVKYHLMDVRDPISGTYNLDCFLRDVSKILPDISARKKLPLIAGGSALYINALLMGYSLEGGPSDTELRKKLQKYSDRKLLGYFKEKFPKAFSDFEDKNNRIRIIRAIEKLSENPGKKAPIILPEIEPLVIGILLPRKTVHEKIKKRLETRLEEGLIEEVEDLHEKHGLEWDRIEAFGLEYREASFFIRNRCSFEDFKSRLLAAIRKFARRQDIWFRKMERQGIPIHWIPNGDIPTASGLVSNFLEESPIPDPEIRLDDIRYGPKSQ